MEMQLTEARSTTSDWLSYGLWGSVGNRSERHMVASLVVLKRTIAIGFIAVGLLAVLVPIIRSSPALQQEDGVKAESIDWSVFLPDGEGKSVVALSCSSCHDLRQVVTQKKTTTGWRTSVQQMVSMYKAPLDKEDLPVLTEYLAKHFGKTNPIERLPMDINSSSAETLARLPGITPELARAIVETREKKGRFESVEELLRVEGIEGPVVRRIRGYITTGHR